MRAIIGDFSGGKEKKGTFRQVGRPPRLQFLSLWVLSSSTTVSVVPNLSSGFYLRCYLCRTSRCFQFLHCCLCQQSGLVKSLPAIRDFSTARSLLLSPLRSDRGVEPWEQQTEIKLLRIGARSVDASWGWLSASCVTVGKGGTEEEAASRQLYTAPTRPAGPTKPTVIPSQATQSPDLKQFRP